MEFAFAFIAVAGVFVSLRLYAEIRSLSESLWEQDVQILDLKRESQVLKEDLRSVIREEIEISRRGE